MTARQRMAILGRSAPPPLTPEKRAQLEAIIASLPKGFGPGHPKWNVPSFRNRWLMAQGVNFVQPTEKAYYQLSPAEPPSTIEGVT